MLRKTLGAIVALTISSVLAFQALAQTTPEDALDYRKAVMTALRGHIATIQRHSDKRYRNPIA